MTMMKRNGKDKKKVKVMKRGERGVMIQPFWVCVGAGHAKLESKDGDW